MKAKYPGNLADELFELEARAANVALDIKAVKEAIVASGEKAIEGLYARVTVSHIDAASIFDATVAKAWLESHAFPVPMKERAGSIRVLAKARIVDDVVRPMIAAE